MGGVKDPGGLPARPFASGETDQPEGTCQAVTPVPGGSFDPQVDYRPNFLARSLRVRRTFTVGTLMPEWSEGCFSLIEKHAAHLSDLGLSIPASGVAARKPLALRDRFPALLSFNDETLLARIPAPEFVQVEPELIVRESTGPVRPAGKPRSQ